MKVSVIVPVYNAERWLRRCVDSVLAQTFSDLELLLVDDGATDGSPAICDEYAAMDSRVRVFHKPNGGVSSARNLALDQCGGGYVTFCDSDDWLSPQFLEILTGHNADLIIGDFKFEGVDYDWVDDHIASDNFDDVRHFLVENYKSALCTAPWGKLFSRQIIEENHLRFNESCSTGEDTIFCFDYMMHAKSVTVDNRALYFYDRSTCGLSLTLPKEQSVGVFIREFYATCRNVCDKYQIPFDDFFYPFRNGYIFPFLHSSIKASTFSEMKSLMKRINSNVGFDYMMRLLFERNVDIRTKFLKFTYLHNVWFPFFVWAKLSNKLGKYSFKW